MILNPVLWWCYQADRCSKCVPAVVFVSCVYDAGCISWYMPICSAMYISSVHNVTANDGSADVPKY